MITNITQTLILLLFVLVISSLLAFKSDVSNPKVAILASENDELKALAFEVLNTKCNVCHRKQNPFMVFNERNMVKRANKIYQQVYLEKRMPKGNETKLNPQESITLKKWLKTQKIN